MAYRYGVSSGVSFNGAVIVDKAPLRSVWATDSPSWQFIQYTETSPAQSRGIQYYQGVERLFNTFVVFRAYENEVARIPIRAKKSFINLNEEVMAVARSLFNDAGRIPETVETFSINLYAPIGVGFYWLPRTVIWEFDKNPENSTN